MDIRGVYRFSSLVKQNKKLKITRGSENNSSNSARIRSSCSAHKDLEDVL